MSVHTTASIRALYVGYTFAEYEAYAAALLAEVEPSPAVSRCYAYPGMVHDQGDDCRCFYSKTPPPRWPS